MSVSMHSTSEASTALGMFSNASRWSCSAPRWPRRWRSRAATRPRPRDCSARSGAVRPRVRAGRFVQCCVGWRS